jgi:CBS-domain-containing membrane protein
MKHNSILKELRLYLGVPTSTASLKDMMLGSLTGVLAILCIIYFSQSILKLANVTHSISSNAYVLTSIAATVILVFSVPHGALSQPWPVFGGHVFSAFFGVLSWKYFGDSLLVASAIALFFSSLVMTSLRCIHPPGGATALGAVLGGDVIHHLGFSYILVPTLLNCIIIIVAGIVLNYPFKWRRYPSHSYFKHHSSVSISPGEREHEITIEDFMKSIHDHGSYIDITDEGWVDIFENAKKHAELDHEHPTQTLENIAYSNGKLGKKWEIRKVKVIDSKSVVTFSILAGANSGLTGHCMADEFLNWAKFEVVQNSAGVWTRSNQYV